MAEGRRYSPENPSPAMRNFAEYIRAQGFDITDEAVAATSFYHREWQAQHAEQMRSEREATAAQRELDKAQKAQEREDKKREREEAKAAKEAEREEKRRQKEAAKAEKAEREAQEGADGDDGSTEEGGTPRRRLRLKKGNDEAEVATAGASAGSF